MPDFAPRSWTNPLRRPGKDFAQHLSPALLNNLLAVGCAILIKETVNLNKLKNHLGLLLGNRQTKTDSHYRRLTRFFTNKTALNKLWKWLIIWVLDYTKRWDGRSRSGYLTLDGTSWQLGTKQIHLLVLCLVYRGVSLPLLWHNLGKNRTADAGPLVSAGTQTTAPTSHATLSPEGFLFVSRSGI